MDLGLKGKKALVTSGTRGIGRAIVDLLVAEGCDVAVCARTPEQVTDAVAAFVDKAADALGDLDIFVSNISGAIGGGNDPASWRHAVGHARGDGKLAWCVRFVV